MLTEPIVALRMLGSKKSIFNYRRSDLRFLSREHKAYQELFQLLKHFTPGYEKVEIVCCHLEPTERVPLTQVASQALAFDPPMHRTLHIQHSELIFRYLHTVSPDLTMLKRIPHLEKSWKFGGVKSQHGPEKGTALSILCLVPVLFLQAICRTYGAGMA